jgi:purine-nucleoside phosphorylase
MGQSPPAPAGPDAILRLEEAAACVRKAWPTAPCLGIVAGSGLGALGTLIEDPVRLAYEKVPHLPRPSVIGHAGELVLGGLAGLPVAVLSGRVHAYEGHPMAEVVFGVRLLTRLGARGVLLTNAAGGIAPWLAPGDLCRIVDHLNLSGTNPLTGPNLAELGPRFPDLTRAYSPELGAVLDRAAREARVTLHQGVYAMAAGPSYETPAEVRMLRMVGATMVGMSTVPEVIALAHLGVPVAAISVISNYAAGVGQGTLDHAEVKAVAELAGPRLLALVERFAALVDGTGGLRPHAPPTDGVR